MEDWSRWYRKDYPVGVEKSFIELKPKLPSYVDSVIDFGCAAGRNLALFDGEYKLYGVDLVPETKIEWRLPFRDLTYIQSRLEDLESKFHQRMDRFACIAHGTLMYLDGSKQRAFVENLVRLGCKKFFVFQEYDAQTLNAQGYWEPTLLNRLRRRREGYAFTNPRQFEKTWFRPEIPTWVRLDAT